MYKTTAKKSVALFDLDGVVFNTEHLYTNFWKEVFARYYPNEKNLATAVKGQTLVWIYDKYFKGQTDVQQHITEALNRFEHDMPFEYVDGFTDFLADLRSNGIHTAVVTSSNLEKMKQVYDQHPNFTNMFDRVLTAENFKRSKPDPYCYLLGASVFNVEPAACIGFEDSISGLKAVQAAGMPLVGLSTSNPPEVVEQYADIVIPDYIGVTFNQLAARLTAE